MRRQPLYCLDTEPVLSISHTSKSKTSTYHCPMNYVNMSFLFHNPVITAMDRMEFSQTGASDEGMQMETLSVSQQIEREVLPSRLGFRGMSDAD